MKNNAPEWSSSGNAVHGAGGHDVTITRFQGPVSPPFSAWKTTQLPYNISYALVRPNSALLFAIFVSFLPSCPQAQSLMQKPAADQ